MADLQERTKLCPPMSCLRHIERKPLPSGATEVETTLLKAPSGVHLLLDILYPSDEENGALSLTTSTVQYPEEVATVHPEMKTRTLRGSSEINLRIE